MVLKSQALRYALRHCMYIESYAMGDFFSNHDLNFETAIEILCHSLFFGDA